MVWRSGQQTSSPGRRLMYWLMLLFVGALWLGCSRQTRHRVLSFFFDGVPPLEEASSAALEDSLRQQEADAGVKTDTTASQQPAWSFHPALEENECATCHDPDQSYRLLAEPEELCLTCHDDKTDAENVHPPVEMGECLECHNPHGTRNPHFLVKVGQALCFQCHDADEVKSSETHEGIEDEACYDCHDPHGGDGEYFLR